MNTVKGNINLCNEMIDGMVVAGETQDGALTDLFNSLCSMEQKLFKLIE